MWTEGSCLQNDMVWTGGGGCLQSDIVGEGAVYRVIWCGRKVAVYRVICWGKRAVYRVLWWREEDCTQTGCGRGWLSTECFDKGMGLSTE